MPLPPPPPPHYRLPLILQTVNVSGKPRLSTATHKTDRHWMKNCSVVLQSCSLCPSPLPRLQQCYFAHRAGALAKEYLLSKLLSKAEPLPFEHQLGLFFLLEARQRNATWWSTAGWPAKANFNFSIVIHQSLDPAAQAPSSLSKLSWISLLQSSFLHQRAHSSTFLHQRAHSSTWVHCVDHGRFARDRGQNATHRRAVEVIICMIPRDFSMISNDVTSVSLYLSLSLLL